MVVREDKGFRGQSAQGRIGDTKACKFRCDRQLSSRYPSFEDGLSEMPRCKQGGEPVIPIWLDPFGEAVGQVTNLSEDMGSGHQNRKVGQDEQKQIIVVGRIGTYAFKSTKQTPIIRTDENNQK